MRSECNRKERERTSGRAAGFRRRAPPQAGRGGAAFVEAGRHAEGSHREGYLFILLHDLICPRPVEPALSPRFSAENMVKSPWAILMQKGSREDNSSRNTGHRGFTHSLVFAACVGLAGGLGFAWSLPPGQT
jgi:hypothetical protein